jgi:uncharacterized RDD family membrane protein YckC
MDPAITTDKVQRTADKRLTTQSEAVARREAVYYQPGRPAPFALRCGALLIDYIVLAGIVALSTLVARFLGGGARTAGGSPEIIGLLIGLTLTVLNFAVLTGLGGQTLGKWAAGLRIERKDGRPLGWGRSFVRHFIGYPLSFLTLGFGILIAAINPRGRALHDLIAGTIVVRDDRRGPLRQ